MPNSKRPKRERGEGASEELMARAETVPGSFTAETRGDVIIYTKTDHRGRTKRAVVPVPEPDEDLDALPPLVWEDVDPGVPPR